MKSAKEKEDAKPMDDPQAATPMAPDAGRDTKELSLAQLGSY